MNGFTFQYPALLATLLLVPVLFVLFRYARIRREALLRAFGGARTPELVNALRRRRHHETRVLLAVALLALVLARPSANPHPSYNPQGGRDVVFILDVSRSMLADDVRPSRLERAKLDIVGSLDPHSNDRVALVVFAGMAAISSPLTMDYEFLKTRLQDASPNSVARGSTYLQSALEKASTRMLSENRRGLQDIILLTDGEDQGSHPENTLAGLNAAGARLLVIGYGDPRFGARVPVPNASPSEPSFIMDEGREVWTKLREEPLRALASASIQGEYIRGGTAGFDLGREYRKWSAAAPRQPVQDNRRLDYDELFAWLLGPAILLLLYPWPITQRIVTASAMVIVLLGLLSSGDLRAEGAASTPFEIGVTAMKSKAFADATKAFDQAVEQADGSHRRAVSLYNAALAHAEVAALATDPDEQVAELDSAVERMRPALLLRADWPEAARGLELLYARRTIALEAKAKKQDRMDQLNAEIQALVKELERLLALQKQRTSETHQVQNDVATADEKKIESLLIIGTKQATLSQDTQAARTRLNEIHHTLGMFIQSFLRVDAGKEAPSVATGLEDSLHHLDFAHGFQDTAVTLLGQIDQCRNAIKAETSASDEIIAAIQALSHPNDEESDEDSDSSKEGDPKTEGSQSSDKTSPNGGDFVSDPVNRDLPRPNFSAEEILQEEKTNATVREKNQPARVGTGEKDW